MISLHEESPEVFYAEGDLISVGPDEIAKLKQMAAQTLRRRCRICFHSDSADRLHEMLIVHEKNAWVPPHMHIGKSESIQVVEGSALLVCFSGDGEIENSVRIGDGGHVFCRLSEKKFHTLLIDSEWLVFKETILGPFDPLSTKLAPWAPKVSGKEADYFIEELRSQI